MKKTKINQLINEIDGIVKNMTGHLDSCKNQTRCICGFDEDKEDVSKKLQELRAEMGIWDN